MKVSSSYVSIKFLNLLEVILRLNKLLNAWKQMWPESEAFIEMMKWYLMINVIILY